MLQSIFFMASINTNDFLKKKKCGFDFNKKWNYAKIHTKYFEILGKKFCLVSFEILHAYMNCAGAWENGQFQFLLLNIAEPL